jgi:hypothetical protein
MTPESIPVGKTIVFVDQPYIKVTVTRSSDAAITSRHIDPATGKVVFESENDIVTGSSTVGSFATDFWDVTIDGKPAPSAAMADLFSGEYRLQLDAESRAARFTSRS